MKLQIVGNPDPVHVGSHLRQAAQALGYEVTLSDSRQAYEAPAWLVKASWRLRGHRPARLGSFSEQVVETCRRFQPDCLLTTGIAPLTADALRAVGRLGVRRLSFLTDDPWNPAHRAPWFMDGLGQYQHVFSPRRANLEDLAALRGPQVNYLPFGFAPEVHFPQPPADEDERRAFDCDVVFVGAGDRDRVPYIQALQVAGLRVHLYGGYWDRFPETRAAARGNADAPTVRKATAGARVALCLVRRANRDGHVMRSLEAPAMRGCMLVEDTAEHRDFFGADGDAVRYFRDVAQLVEAARWLISQPAERERLAAAGYERVTGGHHTYKDRLRALLDAGSAASGAAGTPADAGVAR